MAPSGVFRSHTMTSPLKEPAASSAGLSGWNCTHMRHTVWSSTHVGSREDEGEEEWRGPKRLQVHTAPGESHQPCSSCRP